MQKVCTCPVQQVSFPLNPGTQDIRSFLSSLLPSVLLPIWLISLSTSFFIVVKYTWHKTRHLNHFKEYGSVTLTTLTLLGDFQSFSILQHCSSVPIKQQLPFSHAPQLLEATTLRFCLYTSGFSKYLVTQYLSFYNWLILLSVMSSRFLHVGARVRMWLLFQVE